MFGFGINEAQEYFIMESDQKAGEVARRMVNYKETLYEALYYCNFSPNDFTSEDYRYLERVAESLYGIQ